jgi:hypothetical protein
MVGFVWRPKKGSLIEVPFAAAPIRPVPLSRVPAFWSDTEYLHGGEDDPGKRDAGRGG